MQSMASAGATFPVDTASGGDHHFLIVESRSEAALADAALQGATETLDGADASYDVVSVPGVLEIPAAIAMALEAGDYDGFVALGVVVQETVVSLSHIVPEVTRALLELSVVDSLPLGNGLVSVETEGRATALATASVKIAGSQAARAALAMAALKHRLNA
jgi:6,7-dimethyl-8-ribityllumazine synthase